MALSACDQIRNLIHRYSEALDQGRFDVLDELFADATVRMAMGSGSPGRRGRYPADGRTGFQSAKMSPAES